MGSMRERTRPSAESSIAPPLQGDHSLHRASQGLSQGTLLLPWAECPASGFHNALSTEPRGLAHCEEAA